MTVEWNEAEVVAKIKAAAMSAVINAGEGIREEAIRSMLHDPKTGRIYGSHQASAPGESPARETGRLIASIDTIPDVQELSVTVNAGTEYAAALEFGTEKMEPRPFMRPALAKIKPGFEADLNERIAEVLR